MSAVVVRGVAIGTGLPKIIVPIFAAALAEAVAQAGRLADSAADLAELRLDPLRGEDGSLPDAPALCRVMAQVRDAMPDGMPLLVTVRTAAEGGQRPFAPGEYADLIRTLCAAGTADLIDMELHTAGDAMPELCAAAHQAGLAVVASMHDFDKTPPRADMIAALTAMREKGADICKLAVMPRTVTDAAELLAATADAKAAMPRTPLITMSMGPLGAVTRVCGGAFGSAATFGTAGASSAPGQPDAASLRQALTALGCCLNG